MDTEVLVREILAGCGSPLLAQICPEEKIRAAAARLEQFRDEALRKEAKAWALHERALMARIRGLRWDKRVAQAAAKVVVRALAEGS